MSHPPPFAWEKIEPQPCDLCERPATWKHPAGGRRCQRCPKPASSVAARVAFAADVRGTPDWKARARSAESLLRVVEKFLQHTTECEQTYTRDILKARVDRNPPPTPRNCICGLDDFRARRVPPDPLIPTIEDMEADGRIDPTDMSKYAGICSFIGEHTIWVENRAAVTPKNKVLVKRLRLLQKAYSAILKVLHDYQES